MKSLLLIILATLPVFVFAQIGKGTRFIGGNFAFTGISHDRSEYLTETKGSDMSLYVTPRFGYFIKENLAIGANLNFGMLRSERENVNTDIPQIGFRSESNSLVYGGGVFLRKYRNISDNLLVFFNAGMFYENISSENNTFFSSDTDPVPGEVRSTGKGYHAGASLSPGLVYFATPKLGIELSYGSLYYRYAVSDIEYDNLVPVHEKESSHNYGLNFGTSSLSLGLNYYF